MGSCAGFLVTIGGALLALAIVSRLACGPVPPPKPTPRVPVAVGFRPSAVGQGMVLRIQNTSDRPLENLMVTVTAVGGEKAGQVVWRVPRPLAAGQEVEVGWVELGGWRLAPGESVRVWLVRPGYEPVVVTVPVKAAL